MRAMRKRLLHHFDRILVSFRHDHTNGVGVLRIEYTLQLLCPILQIAALGVAVLAQNHRGAFVIGIEEVVVRHLAGDEDVSLGRGQDGGAGAGADGDSGDFGFWIRQWRTKGNLLKRAAGRATFTGLPRV